VKKKFIACLFKMGLQVDFDVYYLLVEDLIFVWHYVRKNRYLSWIVQYFSNC